MSPPEYAIARGAFVGAMIFGVLTYVLWLSTTGETLAVKIIVGTICGAVAFGALPVVLNWINATEIRNNKSPKYAGVLHAVKNGVLYSNTKNLGAVSMIEIGDSGTKIFTNEDQPIINFYGTPLKVEVLDGEAKVSTQIKDETGKLIAEINKNEWATGQPPAIWDRNYSDDSFEVINPNGDVVLQIRALPDRIQIQGDWYGPDGHGKRMVKSNDPANPGALFLSLYRGKEEAGVPHVPIKRMFQYPSALHFGELSK